MDSFISKEETVVYMVCLFFPKFMMLSITIEKTHIMNNAVFCITLFFVAKLMVSCVVFYSIVLYNVRNDNM